MFTACATPGTSSASSTARRLTASVRAERGGRRQLRDGDQIAAVDCRNKADRGLAELVHAEGDNAGIDNQHDHRDTHDPPDEPRIPMPRACRSSS